MKKFNEIREENEKLAQKSGPATDGDKAGDKQ